MLLSKLISRLHQQDATILIYAFPLLELSQRRSNSKRFSETVHRSSRSSLSGLGACVEKTAGLGNFI
ncbi:hypothetical protein KCU85_g244, partial [Aureobasidium melanogenum]